MKHKYHTCATAHGHLEFCPDEDRGMDCTYSVLSQCQVCNLGEGELTTDCPGERVNYEAKCLEVGGPAEYTTAGGWVLRPSREQWASKVVW